ncbi:thiamine pyrophosphate-binding protein [Kineococcus rhizosphaerae]|uniref:Acetolactate synthase-1/2/3 large subunit n=1 Tax=Kineococcus rhizosphaerae TaxID=559628 RepID=A0A2T0RAZ3_9ACTN|nr:thiamine pyrophosphate-binding protein [Kineococcus rhizosphaerae]PRY18301.1 acetolactate synthase-1/2/3 large subunit [Kineococcus rhizosphaerae]
MRTTTPVTGGRSVVQILEAAGVEVAFGINGAHIDSVYQAALDEGLPIVDTRHEMNAGHAAEGYARVRNALGVALLTAGGGFTNAVTSMANAHLDRTPVLYLAASGPLAEDQTNTLQAGLDQVAIATPVTKWAHRVTRPDLIPRLLTRAIRTALAAPRGPVLLDIPWDVLTGEVTVPSLDWASTARAADDGPAASTVAVERILDLLDGARRPVLLAGSEVPRSQAGPALREFAQRTGVPLFSDYEGLGALTGSPQRVGLVQTLHGLPEDSRPDLVLVLGLRFGLTTAHGSGTLVPHDATVVHVDADAAQHGLLQPVALGIAAEPRPVLEALNQVHSTRWGGARHDRAAWLRTLTEHAGDRARAVAGQVLQDRDRAPAPGRADGSAATAADGLHPFDAVRVIAEQVPPGSVVVADGALTYLWLSETIAHADVSAFLCHGYLGSMGVGMGVALGAQTAARDTPVVLVTGDGSVGYSLAEFDAMVRAELPVVVVVLNNRAWGATLHAQEIALGPDRVVNNRLENGSYAGVAEALGAVGYRVDTVEDLAPALQEALTGGRTACVEVRVQLSPVPPEERVLMGGDPF